MAMDQIKLSGVFECFRNMEIFRDFGIHRAILFVALVDYGVQLRPGNGILGSEQRDVPATGHKPFGDVASHCLPGAILPRRSSPGNRRQDRYALGSHSECMAASTSARGTVAKPVA